MANTFYVIYDPSSDRYVDVEGGLCAFADAEQFWSHNDATAMLEQGPSYLKIVGPCIEGETP